MDTWRIKRPTGSALTGMSEMRDQLVWSLALIAAALLYYLPSNNLGGTVYVGGGMPLVALGFVALAVLCYLRTELAVALLPLSIPLFMMPRHISTRWEFSLSETLVVLCTIAVILRALTGRPQLPTDQSAFPHSRNMPDPPPGPDLSGPAVPRSLGTVTLARFRTILPATIFERPLLLFLAASLLATAAALFRSVALRELRVIIVEPILYYALIVICLRVPKQARRALYAAIAAGTIVSILGLGQALFHPATQAVAQYTGQGLLMVSSVYSSENNLGLFLDRIVPMALAVVLMTRDARRLVALLAVILMTIVLILTHSRGAWLATAVTCLMLVGIVIPRLRALLTFAGAAGAVLLVLVSLQATGPLARFLAQGHGASTLTRLYVWQSALHMIRDHPILGVGPDNFLYYYSAWGFRQLAHAPLPAGWKLSPNPNNYIIPGHSYMLRAAYLEPSLSHPHNVVLDFYVSTGIMGLVAALWLLVSFFRHALRLYQQTSAPSAMNDTAQVTAVVDIGNSRRLTIVMAVVAQVAMIVHGLVDNSYFVVDLAMLFWLSMAVLAVEWRDASCSRDR